MESTKDRLKGRNKTVDFGNKITSSDKNSTNERCKRNNINYSNHYLQRDSKLENIYRKATDMSDVIIYMSVFLIQPFKAT